MGTSFAALNGNAKRHSGRQNRVAAIVASARQAHFRTRCERGVLRSSSSAITSSGSTARCDYVATAVFGKHGFQIWLQWRLTGN